MLHRQRPIMGERIRRPVRRNKTRIVPKLLTDFKKFLFRGNVIDLAVAVVVGTAFTAVVKALVADILTPIIAVIFGAHDFGAPEVHDQRQHVRLRRLHQQPDHVRQRRRRDVLPGRGADQLSDGAPRRGGSGHQAVPGVRHARSRSRRAAAPSAPRSSRSSAAEGPPSAASMGPGYSEVAGPGTTEITRPRRPRVNSHGPRGRERRSCRPCRCRRRRPA